MSVLPPEKLSALRQLIHSHVCGEELQEQIRSCVADSLAAGEEGERVDEEAVMRVLEERGIVEQVMQSLSLSSEGGEVGGAERHGEASPSIHVEKRTGEATMSRKGPMDMRNLFVRVQGGRAFLDHLQHPDGACQSTLSLHVHFRGRRLHSRPVPCACEPDFQEGFLLGLCRQDRGRRKMLSYAEALSISEPVHLVVTRSNARGEMEFAGSCRFEWRSVLASDSGRIGMRLELCGRGSECKMVVGILELLVEVLPRSEEVVGEDVLATQLGVERERKAERERLFLVYAKQWWKEYLQIRPSHAQRLVKIFAQDEGGVSRAVCSFVQPLQAGRLLDGPRQAARFVSLLPFERTSSVGSSGCCAEVWSSLHTMLSQKKGDCEDHAALLCSLLLGFGLHGYVCIGTKDKGLAHAWVMTIGHDGVVTFWEPLTGQRFLHPDFDPNLHAGTLPTQPRYPYRTVGCVFNDQSFYANSQPSDSIVSCKFDLSCGSLWKAMSPEAIRSVSKLSCPPLLPASIDPILSANELETELRALTAQYREDLGLSTHWDDGLSYILSPALAAYETERCLGVCAGNEEFQQAVRNSVPEGYTFKGFPIQFTHRNARTAFTHSLRSPVCAEIVGCRGDHVRLALRVRVYTYPEDIVATWIMFAVKYRSVI